MTEVDGARTCGSGLLGFVAGIWTEHAGVLEQRGERRLMKLDAEKCTPEYSRIFKLCYLGVLLRWVQDEATSGRQDAQKVVAVAAVVRGAPNVESRRPRDHRGAC